MRKRRSFNRVVAMLFVVCLVMGLVMPAFAATTITEETIVYETDENGVTTSHKVVTVTEIPDEGQQQTQTYDYYGDETMQFTIEDDGYYTDQSSGDTVTDNGTHVNVTELPAEEEAATEETPAEVTAEAKAEASVGGNRWYGAIEDLKAISGSSALAKSLRDKMEAMVAEDTQAKDFTVPAHYINANGETLPGFVHFEPIEAADLSTTEHFGHVRDFLKSIAQGDQSIVGGFLFRAALLDENRVPVDEMSTTEFTISFAGDALRAENVTSGSPSWHIMRLANEVLTSDAETLAALQASPSFVSANEYTGNSVFSYYDGAQSSVEKVTFTLNNINSDYNYFVIAAEAVSSVAEEEEAVEEASDAARAALEAADLTSLRLIIGTDDATILAEEPMVVGSHNGLYLLQAATIEEAQAAFLKYYDHVAFITPDAAMTVADDEDPQEGIETTGNVYTEEANPFTALESALEENGEAATSLLIALIDTGASLSDNVIESLSMLGGDAADDNGHGEAMVANIVESNSDAQIVSIKALGADGKGDISAVIAAIDYAIERGAGVINISASAYASEENVALVEAVRRATAAGVIVVGAAGNNGFNAKYYIPGSIEEAIIVGACDADGVRISGSNYGETVDYNVVADSTSEAAARLSGILSARGMNGLLALINKGRVFASDFAGGFLGDDEMPEDGDITLAIASASGLTADQQDAHPRVREWLKKQKYTRNGIPHVMTWDALKDTVENATSDVTIKLGIKSEPGKGFGGIAAYTTVKVPAGITVTIETDEYDTIYTDATTDGIGSFFEVGEGATLNLNGVTLSGISAKTEIREDLVAYDLENAVMGRFFIEGKELKYEVLNEEGNFDTHSVTDLFKDSTEVVIVKPGDQTGRGADEEGYFNIKSEGGNTSGQYLRANEEMKNESYTGEAKVNWATIHHPGQTLLQYKNYWEWHIVERGEGSYLESRQGAIITAYGDVINGHNGAPDVWVKGDEKPIGNVSGNNILTVTPSTEEKSYESKNSDKAFFVEVTGGTLNLNDAELRSANGGKAPVVATGGTVNVNGDTKIHDNRAIVNDTVNNRTVNGKQGKEAKLEDWVAHYGAGGGQSGYFASELLADIRRGTQVSAAGAILASGSNTVVNIGDSNADKNPTIYSNIGEAGAIKVEGGATVNQTAGVLGGENGGNLGVNGGAVHVDGEGSVYNMLSGDIMQNLSLVQGGGVYVSNAAEFNFGDASGINSLAAPRINDNVAWRDGGGIDVRSDNVHLYNGELSGNEAKIMGGGIYVEGDSYDNMNELYIGLSNADNQTNAFVYQNTAHSTGNYNYQGSIFGNGGWTGSNWGTSYDLDGNGGGMWFCNWGSMYYVENSLEVFQNSADHKGDDIAKQAAKNDVEGIVTGMAAINGHEWYVDRDGDRDGDRVDNDPTYFPRGLGKSFHVKNNYVDDGLIARLNGSAQSRLIIHGNTATLGGGIGSNGVVSFGELPMHYKTISAKLDLDKVWMENGQTLTNVSGKKIDLAVKIYNKETNALVKEYSTSTPLDGSSKGTDGDLSWDGWKASINLPTYIFNIDDELKGLVSDEEFHEYPSQEVIDQIEAQMAAEGLVKYNDMGVQREEWTRELQKRVVKQTHLAVDQAQAGITTPPDGGLDYSKPDGTAFDVDGKTGTLPFTNWKIEITETVVGEDPQIYTMDMAELTHTKVANPDDASLPYFQKTADTGFNFYIYKDVYELGTTLTNKTQDIKVLKTDADGAALAGATFELYKKGEDGAFTKQADALVEGAEFTFKALADGDYYIVEANAPEGYNGFAGKIYFSKKGDEITYTGAKDATLEQIAVGKATEYQVLIGGQRLYATENAAGAQLTTNETPYPIVLRLNGRPAGTVTEGTANYCLLAANTKLNVRFADGQAVLGAKDSSSAYLWKVVDGGLVSVADETFRMSGDSSAVRFDKDTFTISVKNYKFDVELTKVGKSGSQEAKEIDLGKAKFTIAKATFNGTQYVTGDAAEMAKAGSKLSSTVAGPGLYRVVEEKTPDGYFLPGFDWFVKVDLDDTAAGGYTYKLYKGMPAIDGAEGTKIKVDDEEVLLVEDEYTEEYKLLNNEIYELPSTGGIGTFWFTILGSLFMGLAVMLLAMKKSL